MSDFVVDIIVWKNLFAASLVTLLENTDMNLITNCFLSTTRLYTSSAPAHSGLTERPNCGFDILLTSIYYYKSSRFFAEFSLLLFDNDIIINIYNIYLHSYLHYIIANGLGVKLAVNNINNTFEVS